MTEDNLKPIEKFFSKESMVEISDNMSFFKDKKNRNIKSGLGMETLWLVSLMESVMDKHKEHTPQSLVESLDLLDSFDSMQVITYKTMIDIKNALYGKDYVRKCCLYAIFHAYANGIDLIKSLQAMHIDEKQLKKSKRVKSKNKPKKLGVKKK